MSDNFPLRVRDHAPESKAVSAVVLVRTKEEQFHLGLLRGAEAPEPVLHFGWHRLLHDEPLQQVILENDALLPSAVILLALDPLIDETLRVLAGRVARKHANRQSDIAFGFGEANATFDRLTGELTNADTAFTCATFVLAMLRSVGVLLVDVTRWRQPTAEDLDWQRRIGAQLLAWIEARIHGDLERAKARIEKDIGSLRFRPTDVAGAACCAPTTWPTGVDDAQPPADALIARLPWPNPQQVSTSA